MIVFYAYIFTLRNTVLYYNIIVVVKNDWGKINSKYDQRKTIIITIIITTKRIGDFLRSATGRRRSAIQSSSRVGETGSIFIGGGVVVVVAADINSAGLATAIMLPPLDDIIWTLSLKNRSTRCLLPFMWADGLRRR